MSDEIKFTTPKGLFGFPCSIDEPDALFADDNNPNDLGDYKCRVVLPADDADTIAFQSYLQEIFDRHVEEMKARHDKKKIKVEPESLPWSEELDEEDEPTGNLVFRTKQAALIVSKKTGKKYHKTIKVFRPDGSVTKSGEEDCPRIGPRTLGQASGEVYLWYNSSKGAGMTLRLKAVKVHELVEKTDFGGSNNQEDYGFDASGEEDFSSSSSGSDGGDF